MQQKSTKQDVTSARLQQYIYIYISVRTWKKDEKSSKNENSSCLEEVNAMNIQHEIIMVYI